MGVTQHIVPRLISLHLLRSVTTKTRSPSSRGCSPRRARNTGCLSYSTRICLYCSSKPSPSVQRAPISLTRPFWYCLDQPLGNKREVRDLEEAPPAQLQVYEGTNSAVVSWRGWKFTYPVMVIFTARLFRCDFQSIDYDKSAYYNIDYIHLYWASLDDGMQDFPQRGDIINSPYPVALKSTACIFRHDFL